MTLRQLLEACSDRNAPEWQAGWREFLARYKNFLYKAILDRGAHFHHSRLRRQMLAEAHEVFMDVLTKLTEDNARILRRFRNKDSEPAFLAFLAILCRRATSARLKKMVTQPLVDEDLEDFKTRLAAGDAVFRCQLYEDVDRLLRAHLGGRGEAERDIHLFKLYVWAGFSEEMIRSTPCFRDLGDRVVDNVVLRLRRCLRENRDQL